MGEHLIIRKKECRGPTVRRRAYGESVFGKLKEDLGKRRLLNDEDVKAAVSG